MDEKKKIKWHYFILLIVIIAGAALLPFAFIFSSITGKGFINGIIMSLELYLFFSIPAFISIPLEKIAKVDNAFPYSCFIYFGAIIITGFLGKILPYSTLNNAILAIIVTCSISYAYYKITYLSKKVKELTEYKETAKPYVDFMFEQANKSGMTPFDFLQYLKSETNHNR